MAESTKELTEQGAKVTTTVAGSSATAAPPAEPGGTTDHGDVLRRLASLEAWQKQASLGQRGTPPDRREEQRIATEKLERYTGSPIAAFQPWVIITNFNDYIPIFAREFGGGAEPTKGSTWVCAHSPERGVSIINYNMGSPNAAIVVDVLSRIPGVFELVLFAGMVGGLPSYGTYDRALQVGDLFVPVAAVRAEAVSDFYLDPKVPAVPDCDLQSAVLAEVQRAGKSCWRGIVFTMNIRFWEFDEPFKAKIQASSADAIDMETATIFTAARRHGLKVAALHLVSDEPFEAPKDKAMAKHIFEELAPNHIRIAVQVLAACGAELRTSPHPDVQAYMRRHAAVAPTSPHPS